MNKDQLIAEQFKKDPRLLQSQSLILETIKEYQANITHVQPPDPQKKEEYKKILEKFAEYRSAKLYFPYLSSGIGNGPLIELLDGSIKYDFINGIGPHYFGHSHPKLIEASFLASFTEDTIMQGHLQQTKIAYDICELLIKHSGMDHCFLTSSGVMANENAMKIIFQKKAPAWRILAFDHCFMGRSLFFSQITDKPAFREGLPLNIGVDYIPFYDEKSPERSTENAVKRLKEHLVRYPKQHAAMCFELIQGEGGFYAGSKEFFTTLMKILKEQDILIFDDEIQTFGRTPELFAFQHFGLQEFIDIISIGKNSQFCATLFKKELAPKAGLLSQTFTSSVSALHGGKKIIEMLLEGNFFGPEGKIIKIHQHFLHHFNRIERENPDLCQGPYGLGAMIAFTPFKGEQKKVVQFVNDLFEAGVISFTAGSSPTRVRFLIPVGVLTPDHIDNAMAIVENTLKKG